MTNQRPTGILVARAGPSVPDCLEAAMRADPSLTIEEAIRTVPISEETLRRYAPPPGESERHGV